ncbi:MAG: hypothetical protein JXM70_26710, partial [Pirellulales bacterium]|nr:hypothetical protein [Pirellulales bacterium]
ADIERIDVSARAGEQFYIRAVNIDPGINEAVDFRLTNLVSQSGNSLRVLGTEGNDNISFSAGNFYRLAVGGVDYSFSARQIDNITIDGSGGQDTITLTGGNGNDNATLAVGTTVLQGSGYQVTATNFEDTTVRAGSGNDSGMAVIYDSVGNDTLVTTPDYTVLTGAGFSSRVEGFAGVLASGAGGGTDTAQFFDSAGNDTFLATPTYSRMRGDGFYLRAKGFESVDVQATAGGYDRAYLFDSAGNDNLQVSHDAVNLSGHGFSINIGNVEYVTARAAHGIDTAVFHTPASGAQFNNTAGYATLTGRGFSVRADSFDRVHTQSVSPSSVAQATVAQDTLTGEIRTDEETLKQVLAQSSPAELYAYELARSRSQTDNDNGNEKHAHDHVLGQLEDWT